MTIPETLFSLISLSARLGPPKKTWVKRESYRYRRNPLLSGPDIDIHKVANCWRKGPAAPLYEKTAPINRPNSVSDTQPESIATPKVDSTVGQAAHIGRQSREPVSHKVLIVDDHEDSALIAQYAVETMGHQGIPVLSGHDAVSAALSMLPDVILLDIWLDGISGIDVIHALKRHTCIANIPIIAVTALTLPEEVEIIKAAGFSSYLAKPYLLKDFIGKVNAYLPSEVAGEDLDEPVIG